MIIQLEEKLKSKTKENIFSKINSIGYKTTEVKTQKGNYLVCIGKNEFDIRGIGSLEGVKDVHRVSESYKLVSRKWKVSASEIDLGDKVVIKEGELAIMAGPCSIESEDQVLKIVKHLVENGVKVMRGGVFKPRSSPYAFRGLGLEGLKMFHKICR
ncbi:MAG: 3-deoxy-7-phosphoheptulonate synthase, partial [Bacteroidia bacterium]|nr:3-deoxy-7-phosphoheptulonate synthase [Bacteroidia bacterium]